MNALSKNKINVRSIILLMGHGCKQNTLGNDVDERRACLVKAFYK